MDSINTTDSTEACACCGDPSDPDDHALNGPLCLDCAAAGCETGVSTCAASMEYLLI